jgi:hypothetical protein
MNQQDKLGAYFDVINEKRQIIKEGLTTEIDVSNIRYNQGAYAAYGVALEALKEILKNPEVDLED